MPDYHGSLVAFEGPTDTISTQLRLLPTSPQILILPSIQSYLSSESNDGAFDPATYIRRIHNAAATRTAAAISFLRDATPDLKRLVFTHGGTPSAYALCIDALARHETGGNRQGAESFFKDMISPGLAGLSSRKPRRRNQRGLVLDQFALFQAQFQDPATRAMRAADALDEQTAALQSDDDSSLSLFRPRPRSMSLPVYGYVDNLGDSAPFYVFGAGERGDAESEVIDEEGIQGRSFFLQSPRVEPRCFYDDDDEDEVDPLEPLRTEPLTPGSASCIGEAYMRSRYSSLALDDGQSVLDAGDVVFGEASLVRMSREVPRRSLKRVKSLDAATARRGSYRELPVQLPSPGLGDGTLEQLRNFSCVDLAAVERLPASPVASRLSVFGSPKTVSVKPTRSARRGSIRPARASYVDRGTEAGDKSTDGDKTFEPILPFSEDMVLYFKDDNADHLLKSLVKSFKAGTYPPQPPPNPSETPRASIHSRLGSTLIQSTPPRSEEDSSSVTEFMETITRPLALDGDYDPFAYDKQPTWTPPAKTTTSSISPTVTPPTPAQTPPPQPSVLDKQGEKIRDFETSGYHTAIALQNALRSSLEECFPAGNSGFHQFSFTHLPELGRLWKPLFKNDRVERTEEERSIDQIIAVGAQPGVKKEFVSGVSRRLELLGSESCGALRSGRLDFRYLLVNAMQSFTAQPLAKQTQNPFTSPYLLATLVIPHLETYIAAHSETGLLLLDYPPEHLPTVLAIQRLVGVDLMKVAQIVDSSMEPVAFTHIRGSPIRSNHIPSACFSSHLSSIYQAESLPVTQANFLLTSSATEDEISNFIDTVSRILVEISPLYAPRPKSRESRSPSKQSFRSHTALSAVPIPSPAPASPYSRTPRSPPSPARSNRSQLTGDTRGNTPPSSSRSHFVISTMKDETPLRRERSWREDRFSAEDERQRSLRTASMEEPDYEDLGVELDMEEKRLMPIFMGREKRISSSSQNSQKAMKFLGLA